MRRLTAGLILIQALFAAGAERVLVDTDSGLFGDDGSALVMLARSPGAAAIAGVTVVSGNVWAAQGAGYTAHILDLLDRADVPVYIGAREPLVHTAAMAREAERRWGKLAFTGAFAGKPAAPEAGPRTGGMEFLIAEIERFPDEVTVLAIGPMTNLAMALRLKPEIAGRIKRLVFMGGNVRVRGNASAAAEFNFWFD